MTKETIKKERNKKKTVKKTVKKKQTKKKANPVGRPPIYKTPEALQKAIDKYFEENKEERKYTISGLALALNFSDRQSMFDYEERGPKFSCVIKRAKHLIENRIEELMVYGKQDPNFNLTGGIVWLKSNAGYTDRQNSTVEIPNKIKLDISTPRREKREEWLANNKKNENNE